MEDDFRLKFFFKAMILFGILAYGNKKLIHYRNQYVKIKAQNCTIQGIAELQSQVYKYN